MIKVNWWCWGVMALIIPLPCWLLAYGQIVVRFGPMSTGSILVTRVPFQMPDY
ncbi:hypothetical [Yersinia pestis KIM10+]|uniref:Uncharacterized protein n=1 Tax=Yersinia pestis TaxID=632 RepID=Q8CKC7_YERPE|nr:hypothetical [Yersinia pestis KIM10+]